MDTRPQRAFTIVELLIVIVVIAILAAITIVAYNGIQDRARDSAASSAVTQAAKKIKVWQIENDSTSAPGSLALAGVTDSNGTAYQYSQSGSAYCITATVGNKSYKLSDTVTSPTSGACAGHGVGGVAPVTNLARNPNAEVDLANMICTGYCVLTRVSDWKSGGTYSFKLSPNNASNDSFMTLGGDLGAFRSGMQAGKTYTLSAVARIAAPQTGTLGGNGTRQVTLWYTTAGGTHVRTAGSQGPNTAGTFRSSVTVSIPSDAQGAWIRLYNGASIGNGDVWWDDIMLTEGNTIYNYADGNTVDWVWNLDNTSTGPPV